MEIPYVVQPRQDTGLYNAKVGIWLFLASEVMLFGALFSSYIILRIGAAPGEWPVGLLNVWIGMGNTLVLITSSITVVLAWASLKMNNFAKFKVYQGFTILLAMTFVVIKSFEYTDKFTHYEVVLQDNTIYDGHLKERTPTHVVIHGHKVEHGRHAEGEAHGSKTPHTDIRIERAQIKKMENYGPWHNTYLAIYFTLTALHALHVIGGAVVIGYLWGPGSKLWKTDPERFTNRIEISGLFWHFVDLVWIFLFPVLYLL
ncbi:MAG: heme-copper oxidase subunit III [Verrucomicrobia bacterium]|nr:heme-copper oxidase subunit III [Verrucomicrobiota bacterium]